ncbi:embryo-specific protein ATS3B-like [Durio zibethinus]|uniref:Embryo-specific protein ATS3B-like n=1 Tax=Durio zibethinus TaxID=66656 RepID=A0A6P6BBG5_DURZI|nr:embryo-specific protein ATS3B-like [Durio zibethinus]
MKGFFFQVNMSKAAFVLLYLGFIFILCEAKSIRQKPQAFESLNVSYVQNLGSCSYSVIISTSCSSTSYNRDQISIAFGDAYGNQIYAPRLDDPSTETFERCSSDTFEINGPCAYQICYVYLYRTGPDGWKPETVKIYGYNSQAVTFYYDTFIPGDNWYGFNYCNNASSSHRRIGQRWFLFVILWFVLCAFV